MALRDSNCMVDVRGMFEELIRAHQDAAPIIRSPEASSGSGRRSPPRRVRSELPFWESAPEQVRVAELAQLLEAPALHVDVLAPWGAPRSEDDPGICATELVPVAMSVAAPDALDRERSYGAGHTGRWLLPLSAGIFAVGAVVASGGVRLAAGGDASLTAAGSADASLASPEADGELTAAMCSDLLAQGALIAVELLEGTTIAPSEGTASADGASSEGAASDDTGPQTPDPVAGSVPAPPRDAPSAHAWTAATRLSRTSGRHIGTESEVASAEPEAAEVPFDTQAARQALQAATARAAACGEPRAGLQVVPVSVTFAPSGRATVAQVGGTLAGTAVGSCVALAMRSVSVPAFSGAPVTVRKTVSVVR
jgi:hypothetical protein